MHKHDKNKEKTANDNEVSCEVCLTSIPASEAQKEEARDYVAYFCGLNCYDKWKHQKSSDKP